MTDVRTRIARQALVDLSVAVAELPSAMSALEEMMGGWPSQVPGAAPSSGERAVGECRVLVHGTPCALPLPCEEHDDVELTEVERQVEQGDRARRDAEQLQVELAEIGRRVQRLARLVRAWSSPSPDRSAVAVALGAFDREVWCHHCLKQGRHNPRHVVDPKSGRTRELCQFCHEFALRHNEPPPREIWLARDARGGRLDETTIKRIMREVRDRRKAAQRSPAAADPASTRAERRRSRLEMLKAECSPGEEG